MEYSLDFPRAHGLPLVTAILKQSPEDFQVEEQLPFTPTGQGEHVLLHIRKTGLNTRDVVQRIARLSKIAPRNISFAGMKDKHAITTQWFSVQVPIKTTIDWTPLNSDDLVLLAAVRHDRKLRRGAVSGNHFRINLHNVRGDTAALQPRLQLLATQGLPNYFGEQRFGDAAQNLQKALRLFTGTLSAERFERGIYLSAARAWLFNQVLVQRVRTQQWQQSLAGDVFWLQGTKRFFTGDPQDAALPQRVAQCDIHPTGPLWGQGELQTSAQARALELQVVAQYSALRDGLEQAGLEQDRRALRVMPLALTWAHDAARQMLTLEFDLPAGAYATSVIREFANVRID